MKSFHDGLFPQTFKKFIYVFMYLLIYCVCIFTHEPKHNMMVADRGQLSRASSFLYHVSPEDSTSVIRVGDKQFSPLRHFLSHPNLTNIHKKHSFKVIKEFIFKKIFY